MSLQNFLLGNYYFGNKGFQAYSIIHPLYKLLDRIVANDIEYSITWWSTGLSTEKKKWPDLPLASEIWLFIGRILALRCNNLALEQKIFLLHIIKW